MLTEDKVKEIEDRYQALRLDMVGIRDLSRSLLGSSDAEACRLLDAVLAKTGGDEDMDAHRVFHDRRARLAVVSIETHNLLRMWRMVENEQAADSGAGPAPV